MFIHLKLGKIRACTLEIEKEFGTKPFFEKKSFGREVIIDIPYLQLIYTPDNWKQKRNELIKNSTRKASNGNQKIGKTTKRSVRANTD